MIKHTLTAGEYYVGDPCYVLEDRLYYDVVLPALHAYPESQLPEDLDDVVDYLDNYRIKQKSLMHIRGRKCVVFSTEWGDGEYQDQLGNVYGVDSGLIACIPVELLTEEVLKIAHNLGRVQMFEQDFVCGSENAYLTFGDIVIDTD